MMSTMTTLTTTTSLTLSPSTTHCCPHCGFNILVPPLEETQSSLLEAQRQISDLQAQVLLLNEKASNAVDRWADYEDELTKLRTEVETYRKQQPRSGYNPFHSPSNSTAPTISTPGPTPLQTPSASVASASSPARSSFLSSSGAASRISALLTSRKSTPNLQQPKQVTSPAVAQPHHLRQSSLPETDISPLSPPSEPEEKGPSTDELIRALSREQALRREAEGKLTDTSREVEELSVSLFEQANEMVATERRARAKLEERVGMLERREDEKRRRLERLESAMGRIERVRALLGEERVVKGGTEEEIVERRTG